MADTENERADDDWQAQKTADDRAIAKLLEESQDGGDTLKLDDKPFDQTNKADDAYLSRLAAFSGPARRGL